MSENQSIPDPEHREGQEQGEPRFSFTDKRKVDPTDGTARQSADPAASEQPAAGAPGAAQDPIDAEAAALYEQAATAEAGSQSDRVAELEGQVAELNEELKRSQAEYVNSRRRIEASAQAQTQAAIGKVLSSLIPALDDIELGRQHGDIAEGTPFYSIAQKIEETLASQGLTRYGAAGDVFDPNLHEALLHEASEDVETNTIKMVMQPGYMLNDRVLRPARVATYGPQ